MNIASCLLVLSALVCAVYCVNDKYNKVPQRCVEPLFKCWTDCRKYMVVHHGKLIKVACPKGLYWNDVIKACDFTKPDDCEIPEASSEEIEVPTTPTPERIVPTPKPKRPSGPPSTEKLKVVCYCKKFTISFEIKKHLFISI